MLLLFFCREFLLLLSTRLLLQSWSHSIPEPGRKDGRRSAAIGCSGVAANTAQRPADGDDHRWHSAPTAGGQKGKGGHAFHAALECLATPPFILAACLPPKKYFSKNGAGLLDNPFQPRHMNQEKQQPQRLVSVSELFLHERMNVVRKWGLFALSMQRAEHEPQVVKFSIWPRGSCQWPPLAAIWSLSGQMVCIIRQFLGIQTSLLFGCATSEKSTFEQ